MTCCVSPSEDPEASGAQNSVLRCRIPASARAYSSGYYSQLMIRVEAIEQMEIELSRLTEELTNREQKLAISPAAWPDIVPQNHSARAEPYPDAQPGSAGVSPSAGQQRASERQCAVRTHSDAARRALREQHGAAPGSV
ncbi:hypothetical protein LN650_21405 [Klebsiella pneumoniae subsp. pneumoniae]|nr:hypothetical protein [Klebsiella pneumoniae subsp. pneumoniae]